MHVLHTTRSLSHGAAALAVVVIACLPAGAQQVDLISRSGAATQGAGGLLPRMSDDGRFLVFTSAAPSLVAGQVDANGSDDVFLYDRVSASLSLVSHVPGSGAQTANGDSDGARISADGNWVVFYSTATDIVTGTDTNADDDVFLYERATGTVRLVSHVAGSPQGAGNAVSWNSVVSADGATLRSRARPRTCCPSAMAMEPTTSSCTSAPATP